MAHLESLPIPATSRIDPAGQVAGHTVVWVQGEHDLSTAASLRDVIARAATGGVGVLVDLSEVSFMDASTVNALVRSQNELRALGLFLHLLDPSPAAQLTLRVCGVTDLVPAIARIRPKAAAPALGTWVDVPAQQRVASGSGLA